MRWLLLIPFLVAADQAVKLAIRRSMEPGDSIPVVSDVFHITYVQNTGAAFSMFESHTSLLAVASLILIVAVMAAMLLLRKEHTTLLAALALIASGGVGNCIDRIWLGYVVDMFDFRIWPVFNVADIAVCVGCGLLLLYVLVFDRKKKK